MAITSSTTRRIGVGDVRITDRAKANVLKALENNRLTYGPFSREFERRFADVHGRRFACFVNSGTDALRIGLAALKEKYNWNDGDGVLVPALTFVASLNVITQNRLTPILVDIDEFYCMDANLVVPSVGRFNGRVVAMMPVSLFGQPADERLYRIAASYGWKTITDSCETMFVDRCARGDVSCFSTFACHILQSGVGGLATTNDPDLAALIRSYANHGRSGIYTGIDAALGNVEVINARFEFDRQGYSSRATEMEAAIACAELDGWEENIARRKYNAARLYFGLKDLPLQLPRLRAASAWMMFVVEAEDNDTRNRLVQHLENVGVETRYAVPLTSQPYVKRMLGEDVEDRFPNAKRVNRNAFYVGCHPALEDSDIDYMVEAFRSFYAS